MKKIALISHGCAKNLVDSELMLGTLAQNGYEITLNEDESDIVIINTCSFIHDAEKESVDSILEMINEGKKVIIAGCLAQKHGDELKKAIPEISGMIGATDFSKIVEVIKSIENGEEYVQEVNETPEYNYPESVTRQQITVGSSSYIKIADGCNYRCGYCIIPYLRGDYRSRKMENIIDEAKSLVKKGVTEIILIAQDTTGYGIDIYKKPMLPELLRELNKIEGLGWIRIMYAYPTQMKDELLDAIAECDKVVKYIDIPLQHSHPEMLKRMNRPAFDYREMIENIRKRIPNVAIRTAFIVGYPGETEEEFEHLYEFIKDMKFNKLGVFEYSREKGTPSYNMKPQISKKVMKERRNKLMELQQGISKSINEGFIGKTMPCIIESFTDEGYVVARTQNDAPEVDGVVYIKTDEPLVPGDIENVKIVDCDEYDLIGEV
ncbi:TPA: 30S ribosomal protein S12 methylthiotransferase RimO [Candidatus Gastranaerophilales bacterium HUM_9]|nr:MAG TPA: 30S ribosomal protein S12 methylthiotransferase RimO [Candidatus Gastranaerophilales bacterium HUM_9]HBX34355.1 30S ribosomal protein S12 methylthiotransferase RimO [Cyanobacteria bacterium UBA11440]